MTPGDAVPDDARAQADRRAIAKTSGGIAPVEHVEHALEQLAGELGVGPRAGDERMEIVDGDAAVILGGDGDRDDVLGEDVQGVAGHDGRLDRPRAHQPADDGALQQVAAELGEEAPAADLADAVAGAPDALQAAGDGLGRLDLQDEVDGAHVDAELERAGCDEAGQLAGLEQLLDLRALLARERAVVGASDLARGRSGDCAAPRERRARSGAARRARRRGGC